MADRQQALDLLNDVLPSEQVMTDPMALVTYEIDAGLDRGLPDGVVFPKTADEVVQIVRWANDHGVPLIARGAGTGLAGGAVADRGGLVIELSHLKRVLEFDELSRSVTVEPGTVNQRLGELVAAKGLYYPPDPASGRTSTLGGNIANNAGGPHCFKYGVTTNYVTGLQVVLANSQQVQFGGPALDYPEYDFVGLLTGSEGTLGIVTAANLQLRRTPPGVKTLMAVFDSVERAGQAVSAIIAIGLIPATMEMMDQKIIRIIEAYAQAGLPTEAGSILILEVDGYQASLSSQMEEITEILSEFEVRSVTVAQTAEERNRIWFARKSAAGAMARLAPAYYLVDGTVPRSQLGETLAAVNQICENYELRVGYVFHAGDGNLHPLILIEDPTDTAFMERVYKAGYEIMVLCVNQDGSITGEHGVGIEKRDYMSLMYSQAELSAMRDIKAVFDPQALLNPGKIFPPDSGETMISGPTQPEAKAPPSTPFKPASAQEAAEAMRAWSAVDGLQTVRLRGGGTKSGWLPPADALLSTQALKGIRAYARDDLYVTVGAGTTLAELQQELSRDQMWVPLVSPWPEATLGGIVSTNLNGPLRMRYGAIRDLALAMTVALPDGRVIRAGRPVVKNVAGYDLPKLFVGAHGTLGLITDVTVKLAPMPRARTSLIIPIDDLSQGLTWAEPLSRVRLVASALLLCRGDDVPDISAPYALVYTAEGLAEDVTEELDQVRGALKTRGITTFHQRESLSGNDIWSSRLKAASANDPLLRLGVASKDLPGILTRLGSRMSDLPFVADLANGILYVRGENDLAALRQFAGEAGGYVVLLAAPPDAPKQPVPWNYTPAGLDLMRDLKSRWDEHHFLNPDAFLI